MTAAGVPKSKATRVADALREDLKEMKPGEQLPTQKQLVERFGYAGQTIQNGLAMLRSEGLIVSAGNLGNFVASEAGPASSADDDIKEIRSQLQALTERVSALEERSASSGGA